MALLGKSKHITIANALHAKTAEEIEAGRKRIRELYEGRGKTTEEGWGGDDEEAVDVPAGIAEAAAAGGGTVISMDSARTRLNGETEARDLCERSRRLLERMHSEDREEAIDLHEKIEDAIESGDEAALVQASRALKELLFFVEGQH